VPLKLISPVAFLSTKYVAFLDRGEGDHDALRIGKSNLKVTSSS